MKQLKSDLLKEMKTLTEKALRQGQDMKNKSQETLNRKSNEKSWSALECLEHLNLYGDFYLPEIESRILAAPPDKRDDIFNSGLIGNYFAKLMKTEGGKIKKMQSPKDKNPIGSQLNQTTVDRFIKQTERLMSLLEMSESVSLNHTKCAISISKMIRLKLGDTLRFYIYHIERHLAQAERALNNR